MTLKTTAALLSLLLGTGYIAQARAASCTSYDAVLTAQKSHGVLSVVIAPEHLEKVAADAERTTGLHTGTPTRGFLLLGNGIAVLGLEVGGCLLDPVYIARGGGQLVV